MGPVLSKKNLIIIASVVLLFLFPVDTAAVLCLHGRHRPHLRSRGNEPQSGIGVRRAVPVPPCRLLRGRRIRGGPDDDENGSFTVARLYCRASHRRRTGTCHGPHLHSPLQALLRHAPDLARLPRLGHRLQLVLVYRRRRRNPRHPRARPHLLRFGCLLFYADRHAHLHVCHVQNPESAFRQRPPGNSRQYRQKRDDRGEREEASAHGASSLRASLPASPAVFSWLSTRTVFPDMLFWTLSMEMVIMCLLGGWLTFLGPMLGAAVIVALRTFVSTYTSTGRLSWVLS